MKKFLFTLFVCLFTLPIMAKNTILIVGDSLSAAYGMAVERAWPALLNVRLIEKSYSYQVINISISGSTTSNGLNQLPHALNQYRPAITVIALGANDALRGLSLSTIKNNLSKMINFAKKSNSDVLLIGIRLPPNYGTAYNAAFQAIFVDLANKYQIKLVPFMLKHIDENNLLFQADRLHPTEEAQEQILNNIWPVLLPLLKE
jgi:acyl-CoA thioesterase-1